MPEHREGITVGQAFDRILQRWRAPQLWRGALMWLAAKGGESALDRMLDQAGLRGEAKEAVKNSMLEIIRRIHIR